MKNFSRRIISLSLILIMILSAAVLNGCYYVKSGKMEKVEGTYQLTHYSGNGDRLLERGIAMYLVIRSDGTGYYAYKDNNTDPYIAEVRCRFTASTEEPGKYDYVEVCYKGSDGYEKLAINAPTFGIDTNLNSQTAVWGGNLFDGDLAIDYYINTDFTRVSRATDLSYVLDTEEFKDAPVLPFDAMAFHGTYDILGVFNPDKTFNNEVEKPLVYFYLDLDIIGGEAKAYYMLKEDEYAHEKTLDASLIVDEYGTYTLVIGGVTIPVNMDTAPNGYYPVYPYGDGAEGLTYQFARRGRYTVEQITDHIDTEYSNYLASKDITE